MTFLISLIALLTERFFHWGHLRQWRWLDLYLDRVTTGHYAELSAFAGFFLLLPPVIVTALVQWLLRGHYYQLPSFVFGTIVLLYAMGPENFWQAFHAGEFHRDGQGTVDMALFSAVYDGVFAVLFWFWVFGPFGAVLYRVVAQSSHWGRQTGSLSGVATVRYWLDWIPVRLFGFLFALGGHFVTAFAVWKKHVLKVPANSVQFLTECGRAALAPTPDEPVSGEEALALLDRVMIIALVLLALLVLAL